MPEKTKITLSEKELTLVQNVDWILTKQKIIQKVYDLFAAMVPDLQDVFVRRADLPEVFRLSEPKIFKGENYLQLPYVIMDYPKYFGKEHVFAIRTMFWWGHFISITLHVSGIYKMLVKENICENSMLITKDLFIGVNENQWQHHFEEDNFLPVFQLDLPQRIKLFEKNNFIKLAVKFDLDQWNDMPKILSDGYRRIGGMLINSPTGEKDL